MHKIKGYSIWFTPENKTKLILSEVITRLSREYNTPNFEPHVTLLGQIDRPKEEVIATSELLANKLNPFEIKLKSSPAYLDSYYRSLFLPAEKSDSLLEAGKLAKAEFSMDNTEYMPHLSLLYSPFSAEKKKEIIQSISLPPATFTADKLTIVSTMGLPEDWFIVTNIDI